MPSRYSPRINVTIPPTLLKEVERYQLAYNWKRSAIIQIALKQWLAIQPPIVLHTKKQQPAQIENDESDRIFQSAAGPITIDPEKSFHDHQRPGMSASDQLGLLMAYEAAVKEHYHGR